jgi:hypothetical protein
MRLIWILPILGALAAGVELLSVNDQHGAPQQSVVAGLALSFVVIPYVLARAVTELFAPPAKREPLEPENAPAPSSGMIMRETFDRCPKCHRVRDLALSRDYCQHCGTPVK